MRTNAVVGLKPDLDNRDLLDLATSVVKPGGRLHLVSLVQVGKDSDEAERLEAVRAHTNDIADRLRAEGFDVQTRVEISAVALGLELARIATNVDADLLVLGLAKRSRVGKALLGSDAQAAMMHAECPILATRLS